jgi:hypothetical protein
VLTRERTGRRCQNNPGSPFRTMTTIRTIRDLFWGGCVTQAEPEQDGHHQTRTCNRTTCFTLHAGQTRDQGSPNDTHRRSAVVPRGLGTQKALGHLYGACTVIGVQPTGRYDADCAEMSTRKH